MVGKSTIFTGKNGKTYFDLKAGNGKIAHKSPDCKNTADALNGVASVQKRAANAASFMRGSREYWPNAFQLRSGPSSNHWHQPDV